MCAYYCDVVIRTCENCLDDKLVCLNSDEDGHDYSDDEGNGRCFLRGGHHVCNQETALVTGNYDVVEEPFANSTDAEKLKFTKQDQWDAEEVIQQKSTIIGCVIDFITHLMEHVFG